MPTGLFASWGWRGGQRQKLPSAKISTVKSSEHNDHQDHGIRGWQLSHQHLVMKEKKIFLILKSRSFLNSLPQPCWAALPHIWDVTLSLQTLPCCWNVRVSPSRTVKLTPEVTGIERYSQGSVLTWRSQSDKWQQSQVWAWGSTLCSAFTTVCLCCCYCCWSWSWRAALAERLYEITLQTGLSYAFSSECLLCLKGAQISQPLTQAHSPSPLHFSIALA